MITELKIENYKSIQDLTLDVGRVNVLIGENGCGKSNILEAITFAAAAEANKLDNEFLVSRGIRVTEPELMRSAFNNENLQEPIKISVGFKNLDEIQQYTLINDNKPYAKWTRLEIELYELQSTTLSKKITENNRLIRTLENCMPKEGATEIEIELFHQTINSEIIKLREDIYKCAENFYESRTNKGNKVKNFIIYSPKEDALKNFYTEGQIEPLGINGEGLFKLLKVIQSNTPEKIQEIHNCLLFFDWYEKFEIPKDLSPFEKQVTITDRYLILSFGLGSANEGFLFVFFYIALMVSDDTPKIFAIENIDVALNPKLCAKLIKELVHLSKKYDKQLFVTSHNPAILDGIDLGDEEQRLFVVSRNKQGHTRCKRIEAKDKPKSSVRDMLSRLFNDNETYNKEDILNKFDNYGDPLDISYAFSKAFDDNKTYTRDDILNKFDNSEEPVKLSYAFLRGYLGGLPKNF